MDYKVKVNNKSQIFDYTAPAGTNLLKFLLDKGYEMYSPCNGKGTCGKCRIKLLNQDVSEPNSKERKVLGEKSISDGYRLACQININADLEVYLDSINFKAKVLTEGKQNAIKLSPSVIKKAVALPAPNLEDQRSDSRRLMDSLSLKKELQSLELIRQLPGVTRKENYSVTAVFYDKKLIGIEAGDTVSKLYGIAVDIGTTTIAAYLYNLNTGERLSTYSCLNPQKRFGADVISRIKHTLEAPDGLEEMHKSIIDGMNTAIGDLTAKAGISRSDVYEMVFVGNTTMVHFLLNISAKNIASSPFIPTSTQTFIVKASELGINANRSAIALVVPSVAAYIGADTVSAVLASGMNKRREVSLLVDFGTNGEIVLGNDKWLMSCSAAAGPAFEGANIRSGVGGIRGAIDSFVIDKGAKFTTIGQEKAVGICGTGLVDIVSELFKAGIVDETGRLETDPDELTITDPDLLGRLGDVDGMDSFTVASGNETANQENIYITQKDIRELQNAKAAIAAGIKVLVKRAGISFQDVDKVYLAGGFGTYINPNSALNIGLIPGELKGKLEAIGNAAGIGATEILLSKQSLKKAEKIKERIKYVELSACKEFNDFFVDAMMFEEE